MSYLLPAAVLAPMPAVFSGCEVTQETLAMPTFANCDVYQPTVACVGVVFVPIVPIRTAIFRVRTREQDRRLMTRPVVGGEDVAAVRGVFLAARGGAVGATGVAVLDGGDVAAVWGVFLSVLGDAVGATGVAVLDGGDVAGVWENRDGWDGWPLAVVA